jgi:hypothetical protein
MTLYVSLYGVLSDSSWMKMHYDVLSMMHYCLAL